MCNGARKEKKRKKIKEKTLNGFLAQGEKMAQGKEEKEKINKQNNLLAPRRNEAQGGKKKNK